MQPLNRKFTPFECRMIRLLGHLNWDAIVNDGKNPHHSPDCGCEFSQIRRVIRDTGYMREDGFFDWERFDQDYPYDK